MKKLPKINGATMVGLACKLGGPVAALNFAGDLAFEEDFRSDNPDVVYRMIYEKSWNGRTMRCRKWFGTWRAARAFRDRLCRDGDKVVSITCYDADPDCDLPTTLGGR